MKLKLLLPIILVISSCDNKQPKSEYEISREKENFNDSMNKVMTSAFFKNNNAISIDDTAITYTFQFQEKYETSHSPIALNGNVRDIIKKDSNYIAIIDCDYNSNSCIAYVTITENQLQELLKFTEYIQGHFIISATSFKTNSLLNVGSYADEATEGEQTESHVTYDFRNVILIINGKLIDYLYDRDDYAIISNPSDTANPKSPEYRDQ